MGIHDKLVNIQSALKSPKGQVNNFGGFNYRSCEDILTNLKPLLEKQGLSITLSDQIEQVGERIYVRATIRLTDGESEVTTTAYAREAATKKGMDDSQITGTASSYARKYALAGMFAIDNTKDADTMDNSGPAPYSKKEFDKNKEAWKKLIGTGKYTTMDIYGQVEKRGYLLTDAQITELENGNS